MEVWVVEWSKPSDNEINTTIWDTEKHALMAACADILDSIVYWDLDDGTETREIAEEINSNIASGNYRTAINHYNDYQSNADYDYQDFFSVYSRDVQVQPNAFNFTAFPSDEHDGDCDCDECCDSQDEDEEEEEGYQATVAGATCRGSCGNYNPDAYADMPDGTYCCYSCRNGLS